MPIPNTPIKYPSRCHNISNRLSLNHTLLPIISTNTVIVLSKVITMHMLQELLIVSDDDELEVGLVLASLDDSMQSLSQSLDIVLVEVRSRFVERNNLLSLEKSRKQIGYLLHS